MDFNCVDSGDKRYQQNKAQSSCAGREAKKKKKNQEKTTPRTGPNALSQTSFSTSQFTTYPCNRLVNQ
jgi:hypothetical protein